MFEGLRSDYRAVGVALDRASYDRLSTQVCTEMKSSGPGYFTIGDVSRLSQSDQQSLARSAWLIFAMSCYPDVYSFSDADMDAMVDLMATQVPEYTRRLEAAGLASPSSGSGSAYTGSSPGAGSGYSSGGSSGSGYSTMCNDGTLSQSGGKRGACSWHGGVSK